jgi:hypothetical protein
VAGYHELFGYIDAPKGTWASWKVEQAYLEQWFDASGFGGGIAFMPATHRPQDTRKALRIFREVYTQHPQTQSAAMARYYSAVILDYCLKDLKAALADYEAFLKMRPASDPFAVRASKRDRRRTRAAITERLTRRGSSAPLW